MIDGPEAVLNSNEENNPIITDNRPPIIEKITIFFGLSEIFRAIAAGMINIPVINNNPTILIEIAIIAASLVLFILSLLKIKQTVQLKN